MSAVQGQEAFGILNREAEHLFFARSMKQMNALKQVCHHMHHLLLVDFPKAYHKYILLALVPFIGSIEWLINWIDGMTETEREVAATAHSISRHKSELYTRLADATQFPDMLFAIATCQHPSTIRLKSYSLELLTVCSFRLPSSGSSSPASAGARSCKSLHTRVCRGKVGCRWWHLQES